MDTVMEGIKRAVASGINEKYTKEIDQSAVLINDTRPDFPGEYTVVLFPYLKLLGTRPDELGDTLGAYLVDQVDEVKAYNVVKGFLNLEMTDDYWTHVLDSIRKNSDYGQAAPRGKR